MRTLLAALTLALQVALPLRVVKDSEGDGLLMVEGGHTLNLECDYKLEGDTLYSLKWYRDDKEFYRYIPRESPPVTIFVLPGVTVADSSTPTRLSLRNTSLETNGIFKCEISAGPPRFQTDIIQTRIQVVELPSTGPKILGVDSKYQVGDLITARCVSPPSVPPVVLTWYINSDTAVPGEVGPQKDMEMSEAVPLVLGKDRDMDRVISRSMDRSMSRSMGNWPIQPTPSPAQPQLSVLPLSFVVRPNQLEAGGSVRLKCTASVLDLYWRSSEVATVVRPKSIGSWLAFSNATKSKSPPTLLLMCSAFLHCVFSHNNKTRMSTIVLLFTLANIFSKPGIFDTFSFHQAVYIGLLLLHLGIDLLMFQRAPSHLSALLHFSSQLLLLLSLSTV